MSLMHLLAVGKSIRNIKDHPSRYRVTRDKLLPKFGSAEDHEASAPMPGAANVATEVENGPPAAQAPPPALPGETESESDAVETQTTSPPEVVKSPLAYPRGRWTLMKNPFARKPDSRTDKAPVQAELSLDAIKVVRNDLSDADLEVVPARPGSAPVQAKPPPAEEPAAVGVLLGRITGLVWHRQNLKQ